MRLSRLRWIVIFTVAYSFLAATLVAAWPAEAATRHERAAYRTVQYPDNRWSSPEIAWTIKAAVDAMWVPGGAAKAIAVAKCESGLDQYAGRGQADQFRGVYQHGKTWWAGRVADYRRRHRGALSIHAGASIYSARANVLVTIDMAHRGGWGPWSCA